MRRPTGAMLTPGVGSTSKVLMVLGSRERFRCCWLRPEPSPDSRAHLESDVHLKSPTSSVARLLSVNVGLPRNIEWKGRTVHTGIWKNPVPGRRRVGRLNLDGDGQGDLAGHGGEQRAVFVYQIESYRHWQEQLKRPGLGDLKSCGQFGENF